MRVRLSFTPCRALLFRHQFGQRDETATVRRIPRADNDVVQQFKAHNLRAFIESHCRLAVGLAGRGVARRVVVRNDYFRSVRLERLAENRARVYSRRAIFAPYRDENGLGKHLPAGIQRQHVNALFLLDQRHRRPEYLRRISGGLDDKASCVIHSHLFCKIVNFFKREYMFHLFSRCAKKIAMVTHSAGRFQIHSIVKRDNAGIKHAA